MSRRPPSGDTGTGTSSRGVVLLVVALLVGIFVLKQTQVDTSASTGVRTSTATTRATATTKGRTTATTAPPATTRPARAPAEVKVLPANGSGVAGLGTRVGERLRAKGYNALAPANTSKDITTSVVEYNADFEPEAKAVAEALGLPASSVKALEASPPVSDTKGADVVVLIGPDLETAAGASGTTSTTRK